MRIDIADTNGTSNTLVCDVVIPAGWARSFWIPFVYRNAKPACLKELDNFGFESSLLVFPRDYPDTRAGAEYRAKLKRDAEEAYFKHPPAHRPNYVKLGIRWPFCADYPQLLSQLHPELDGALFEKFSVVRSQAKLDVLRNLLSLPKEFFIKQSESSFTINVSGSSVQFDLNELVWIQVVCQGKGSLADWAVICEPKEGDFEAEVIDEEAHEDKLAKHRAKLRAEHKAELARTHRRRQRERRKRREQAAKVDVVRLGST